MYSTETEIYTLATCPGTKYSGDTITLRSTPRDGIGPYYVAFKKDGIIIDPSRLGGQPNPITNAPENVEITRTYTLDDVDVSNALTGTIDFSVFIRGSCPTGGGLHFDGVNDYVDAGNATSLNITDAITIEYWVKYLGGGEFGLARGWNRWRFFSYPLSIYNMRNGTYSNWNTGWSYTNNVWYHITWVNSGTSESLYVNGVFTVSRSVTGMLDSSGNLYFGGYPTGNGFNGTIDEVRIYNRALSPTEILNNYNGYVSRNGLVLEHIYSLGNANDLSGYGNNGTPVNGPVFIPNACMDTCTVAIGCIAPICNFVVT